MAVQIQLRRDVAAQWTSVNPVLAVGEVGLETDTRLAKFGNGASAWTSLPYWTGGGANSVTSNELSVILNTYSARTTAGASVHGIQSILNALSNRISAGGGGGGSVTSNEASAISAQAASAINVVSNALSNEVSNRLSADGVLAQGISVVSNALSNEISNRASAVNVVSNAVSNEISNRTSADTILADAISVVSNALSNEISNRISADNVLSNRVSLLCANLSAVSAQTNLFASVHGLQSIVNALSNRISVELSVRGAAATSIDGRINSILSFDLSILSQKVSTISQNVSVVSNALSNEISNRTSADNALSNLISTTSAAVTSVDGRVNSVNAFISGISARSVGNVSTHGLQSVINALSNRISAIVGGSGSVTSDELSAVSAQAASAISVLSSLISNVSARSADGTSVRGIQSAINQLSNKISIRDNELSNAISNETSNRLSADGATSAQAASAISVVQANVSLLASIVTVSVSNQISITNAAVSNLTSAHNAVSNFLSGLSARSVGNVSTHGLQSILNALSNRISAVVGGSGSVTSTEVSAVSAQAASALSQAISVGTATANDISNNLSNEISNRISADNARSPWVGAVMRIVSNLQSINTSAVADVSGLVVTVAAGELWRIDGVAMLSTTAVNAGLKAAFSVPPLSAPTGVVYGDAPLSVAGAIAARGGLRGQGAQVSGSSIFLSAISTPAGSVFPLTFGGVFNIASAGTIRLQLGGVASTAASPLHIIAGSHLIAYRLR